MGLLDDAMANDAIYTHNTDELGESVGYTPLGGSETTYTAVIDRMGIQPYPEQPDAVSEVFRVSLAYDSSGTHGPSAAQAGDSITLPKRYGASPSVVRVMHVEDSGPAGWVLECR